MGRVWRWTGRRLIGGRPGTEMGENVQNNLNSVRCGFYYNYFWVKINNYARLDTLTSKGNGHDLDFIIYNKACKGLLDSQRKISCLRT